MGQSDVTQIKVVGQAVGIIGLNAVLKDIEARKEGMSDQEIRDELMKRLSRSNYIPDKVKSGYGDAFLREFKKLIGAPFEEEVIDGLDVKILGPGCVNCDRLEMEVMSAMSELKLQGSIDHVREIKEIGKYGVMGTPALVINGKIKSVGRVPPRAQIKEWLKSVQ